MRHLLDWIASKLPTRTIPDHIDPSVEYLKRSYLTPVSLDYNGNVVRHRRFELCLHKILVSDSDYLHNHSAPYFSLILSGSYLEHTPSGSFVRRPGHMRVRGRHSYHRLELIDGPVYTLFAFLNRDLNDDRWGFLVNGRYVNHEDHLGESA